MSDHKKSSDNETTRNDSSGQTPAVPPPDDPLRRATEFDPDREYKSREMAKKRLEAIRKTREMPTADEESSDGEQQPTASKGESDST